MPLLLMAVSILVVFEHFLKSVNCLKSLVGKELLNLSNVTCGNFDMLVNIHDNLYIYLYAAFPIKNLDTSYKCLLITFLYIIFKRKKKSLSRLLVPLLSFLHFPFFLYFIFLLSVCLSSHSLPFSLPCPSSSHSTITLALPPLSFCSCSPSLSCSSPSLSLFFLLSLILSIPSLVLFPSLSLYFHTLSLCFFSSFSMLIF